MPAMARAGRTSIAYTATGIDLAHHPLPDNCRKRVTYFNDSDEFMTDRSVEPGIPADDLEIGIANTR